MDMQKEDLEFMEFLGENSVPFAIVFTKADKLPKTKVNNQVNSYLNKIKDTWEELPPYFITSASTNMGKEELLNYIESVNESLKHSC